MISRRQVLGALGAGVIATSMTAPKIAAASGVYRAPFRAVCDLKLEGARALGQVAASAGCDVADPKGELVHLFQGEASHWLSGQVPVLGYTSWADYHMMGEIARASGRWMTQAALLSPDGLARELVSHRQDKSTQHMRALLDSACLQCSHGGIGWIIQV